MTVSDRVVVIGGGFAGVAAACRLAQEGHRPILLERSGRLGGRAASFRDRATGENVDYAQHVTMRCCTATDGFLRRIGASDAVAYQPELAVPILCGGTRAALRSNLLLPGLLHLAPALVAYRCLSPRERLGILRAAIPLRLGVRSDEPFGPWLRARGQGERAVERFWNPICVATLNARVDDVAVHAARKVFRDGFFDRQGAGLGLFTVPLGRVFEAARAYVEAREGAVRASTGACAVRIEAGRATAVETSDGETLDASAVVAAVPPWDLSPLVDDVRFDPIVRGAGRLRWSPIVDVHLWLDRPVLDDPFAVAVDGPLQAVFDVTGVHGSDPSPAGEDQSTGRPSPKQLRPRGEAAQHLVLSQSAADRWIDRPTDGIADDLAAALGDLVPAARAARVVRLLVVKHRRATFVPAPGADACRPGVATPIDRLCLAGDWTATGWPSTIESAVRSGIAAAGRVAGALDADARSDETSP